MFVTAPAGAANRTWMTELNGPGVGSASWPVGSAGIPGIGSTVACAIGGVGHFSFVAEQVATDIVGEAGDLWVTLSGRGPMALLENAIVAPYADSGSSGRAASLQSERAFHWASADSPDHDLGVTWGTPETVAWVDDTTARSGYPLDWPTVDPDGAACWIWSTDPTLPAPDGAVNWFRYVFGTAGPMRVWFTADDAVDLFLDGVSLASFGVQDGGDGGWMTMREVDVDPGPGQHVLAAKVTNRGDMGTVDNPAGFLLMARLMDPEFPDPVDWTVAIASDATWEVTDTEPTWELSDIWATLMAEAAARGAGPLPSVSFTSGKRLSRSWSIGTTLLSVLEDCIALGCVARTTAAGVVIVADAPPGGAATLSGVQSMTVTESQIGPTRALVRHDDGMVWEGTGTRETYVEVGGTDSDDSASTQGGWMLDAAAPRTTVQVGEVAALGTIPLPGESVSIVGPGSVTMSGTIIGVSVSETDTGLASYVPEIVLEAT